MQHTFRPPWCLKSGFPPVWNKNIYRAVVLLKKCCIVGGLTLMNLGSNVSRIPSPSSISCSVPMVSPSFLMAVLTAAMSCRRPTFASLTLSSSVFHLKKTSRSMPRICWMRRSLLSRYLEWCKAKEWVNENIGNVSYTIVACLLLDLLFLTRRRL